MAIDDARRAADSVRPGRGKRPPCAPGAAAVVLPETRGESSLFGVHADVVSIRRLMENVRRKGQEPEPSGMLGALTPEHLPASEATSEWATRILLPSPPGSAAHALRHRALRSVAFEDVQ